MAYFLGHFLVDWTIRPSFFAAKNKGYLYRVIFSSDRSSCNDDGLLYIYPRQLFQIFTQSIDSIDVTSVTLSRLNSINAIDITAYLGDILGEFLG